jgi:hypothetical protein
LVVPGYDVADVAVDGDYAYVVRGGGGIGVVDISDPMSPTHVGEAVESGLAYCVAVDGDYAYVGRSLPEIVVFDVSDPTNPVNAGHIDGFDDIYGIALDGNRAYLAAGSDGLKVVDITDPTSPTVIGTYDTPGVALAVEAAGRYVYIADQLEGLIAINVGDPTSPTLAGQYDTPGWAEDLAVDGDYAYVMDFSTLQVINIRVPELPTLAGSFDPPADFRSITLSGDYAFMTFDDSPPNGFGLHVIDVSNPLIPEFLDSLYTLGSAPSCAAAGDYVYVADSWPGFQAIKVFDRRINFGGYTAQSTIMPQALLVEKITLNTVQTDAIRWEVTADGGTNWEQIVPGAGPLTLTFPGSDFGWRASLALGPSGGYPTCDSLIVDLEPLVPVLIQNFWAKESRSGVELTWDIFADEAIKGFDIFRGGGAEDERIKLNNEILPAGSRIYTDHTVKNGWSYRYTLVVVKEDGSEVTSRTINATTTVRELALHQNVPNPFNPATTISFELPEDAHINLSVYTIEGRLVRTLADEASPAGVRDIPWDGKDNYGNAVSSGVYFYRLNAGKKTLTKKMVLLR